MLYSAHCEETFLAKVWTSESGIRHAVDAERTNNMYVAARCGRLLARGKRQGVMGRWCRLCEQKEK